MAKVITVPWLPGTWRGFALVWVVLIRRGYEHFLPHEMVHIRQQEKHGWCRYFWRFFTDQRFRAQMEVEAYRGDGRSDSWIKMHLVTKYRCRAEVVEEVLNG